MGSFDPAGPTTTLPTPSVGAIADGGYLLVIDGTTSRRLQLPRNGVLLIGRADDADVRTDHQSVSRRHAEIVVADGEARIADLGSHNGTFVGGERIEGARALASGDAVLVGELTLFYRRAPSGHGRRLLDASGLARRLDEEVDRVRATGRPVGVIAIVPGADAAGDTAGLVAAVDAGLRGIDAAGWSGEGVLHAILPDRDHRECEEVARGLIEDLAARGVARAARAGFAAAPADGCDGPALIAVTRAVALAAAPGDVGSGAQLATVLELGERRVLVADPAMVRLYELIRRLAAGELPVLVVGETGAGKENAAWAVHYHSRRRDRPFVTLNCAAITETLVESELFGHEKGAFSGAAAARPGLFVVAHGGTLFLDEVGELSPAVQAKLLRVLEVRRLTRVGGVREIPVDIRVVAATNRDLEAEVEKGGFRRDLYFRLGAATVTLPALRDRPREIALLARRFLADACARLGREPMRISTEAMVLLARWRWPGNVRELKNLMDYVAVAFPDEALEPYHLPEAMAPSGLPVDAAAAPHDVASARTAAPAPAARLPGRSLPEEVRAFERERILEALAACDGVRVRAAEHLRLPLRTLLYKLKQHGITGR